MARCWRCRRLWFWRAPLLYLAGIPRASEVPDQVSRASGREVVWRRKPGHGWAAAVCQRTLSDSGCPECYGLEAVERSKAGKRRAQAKLDQAA